MSRISKLTIVSNNEHLLENIKFKVKNDLNLSTVTSIDVYVRAYIGLREIVRMAILPATLAVYPTNTLWVVKCKINKHTANDKRTWYSLPDNTKAALEHRSCLKNLVIQGKLIVSKKE